MHAPSIAICTVSLADADADARDGDADVTAAVNAGQPGAPTEPSSVGAPT
jgi:hypothetical protein